MDRLKEVLATFFYLGYAPVASGTFGSAGALALAWLLCYVPARIPYAAVAALCVILFLIIGVPLGHWAEKRYGKKDPGQFVLDEVMGFFVPLCFFVEERPAWDELGVAFFLFRLFDVIKPFPARRLEKLPGGWGIMLDDFFAGLYTLAGTIVYHGIRQNASF
ncbi:MAG: phosphatidylglycerophosphatase A [Planctomycetes bacterium]|nr:phosphatidylglycerophosphatase A [Planctomycetota bacterium]